MSELRKGLAIQKETTRMLGENGLFQREDATEEAAAPVCRSKERKTRTVNV